ncbi:hypothetical protein EJ04DRAFT_2183 [Polyplosphaeria fusca]|uniref:Uncharacterized protein n=1 Tax=Polyplosphaeria fusca TaxID=682080 RepID=A0A9P4V964_9PLEO|nr:hypothetical protein EJ04DRAFT_2183 [Polyplosphaeria fusca]
MLFQNALLAVLASASFAAAFPGGYDHHPTCSAVYETKKHVVHKTKLDYNTKTKYATVTKTKIKTYTVPETYCSTSTYYSTCTETHTYPSTSTYVVTKTKCSNDHGYGY